MTRPTGDQPIDWDRLEALYTETRALSGGARAARIARVRETDPALARELASLLSRASEAEPLVRQLARAVVATAADLVNADAQPESADHTLGIATDDRSGTSIAQYRIAERIGSGGMGVVYRAWDTHLNRPVALKFLAPHLGVDRTARERLLLEARAAAAMDHPNICTVHEVGEASDGALFIAMACYDGETLKHRLARGRLAVDAAVRIAAQTARALGAAHARGIVHRDVKPANLFLTSGDTVRLLDFGLARLPDVTLTRSGVTPGTVAYMAPEQVRGGPVDARTDLWSLGAVLYEMLCGRRPFPDGVGAALLDGIASGEALPVSRLRDAVPPSLDAIVAKLLNVHPPERYHSAEAVADDLERVARGEHITVAHGGHPAATARAARRWWGRHRRLRLLGGAVSVAVGAAALGWALTRTPAGPANAGAASVLGERILVADFGESAGDTTLGAVVSEALRMGLARSRQLRITGSVTVSNALRRMRRAPDARLAPALAREVATREGIKAVLQGEVQRTGGRYLITAALEDAGSGDRIEGWRVTAHDSTQIPAAVDRLIDEIRTSVGISIASIAASDPPQRLTTASLTALRKQWEGLQAYLRGDYVRAIRLLEEATALDPDFAVAYSILGIALSDAGARDTRILRSFRRAYELRDQLTDSERYVVVGLHAMLVLADLPTAIAAFQSHIEVTRGTGEGMWYASLGEALMEHGEFVAAETALQEARRLWPTARNQEGLVTALVRNGKDGEAREVLEEARARHPRHPMLVVSRANLEARAGGYARAHAVLDTGVAGPGAPQVPLALATLDATQGKLREALGHLRVLQREQRARPFAFEVLETAAAIGTLRVRLDGADAAVAEVEEALAELPASPRALADYPYLPLARFFVAAGRLHRARQLFTQYDRHVPPNLRGPNLWLEHRVRAAISLAEGKPRDALSELRLTRNVAPVYAGPFDSPYMTIDQQPELARVYARLARPDSALAVYERYLEVPDLYRTNVDALELGSALMHTAQLYEQRGDARRAVARYRQLADLWSEADPGPGVTARRAAGRAALIGRR